LGAQDGETFYPGELGGTFSYKRNIVKIGQEEALDGIYVVRTVKPADRLGAEDTVRSYKNLTHVERAFRSLKGVDLLIARFWHHTGTMLRAHIFICMLAYYVEWHMRKAWRRFLFGDEELDGNRKTRDPVKLAKPSVAVERKKARRLTRKSCGSEFRYAFRGPGNPLSKPLSAFSLNLKDRLFIN